MLLLKYSLLKNMLNWWLLLLEISVINAEIEWETGGRNFSDWGLVSSRGDYVEEALHAHIFEGYQKDIRPHRSHRATNITFGFLLQMVVDVNEKEQVMTTRSWINMMWLDERLSWNVTHFDNIKVVHIPHNSMWKPDVMLANSADIDYKKASVSSDIFVTSKGNATWLSSAIFRSICQIRVRFYPFDEQECTISFASLSHSGSELNLVLPSEQADISSYENNSEFQLQSVHVKKFLYAQNGPGKIWPLINVYVRLKRRPLFYVFNHIFPAVIISLMGMLGFFVPPDTGEKATLCITTTLSMGVYLKYISEVIPPTADAIPLLGIYYVVSLFIVCSATAVSVWVLNLNTAGFHTRASRVPKWARKWIIQYIGGKIFRIHFKHNQQLHKEYMQLQEEEEEEAPDEGLIRSRRQACFVHKPSLSALTGAPERVQQSLPRVLPSSPADKNQLAFFAVLAAEMEFKFQRIVQKIYRSLEYNSIRQKAYDEKLEIIAEWRNLAVVADRLLFVLYVIVIFLTTVVFIFEPAVLREQFPSD